MPHIDSTAHGISELKSLIYQTASVVAPPCCSSGRVSASPLDLPRGAVRDGFTCVPPTVHSSTWTTKGTAALHGLLHKFIENILGFDCRDPELEVQHSLSSCLREASIISLKPTQQPVSSGIPGPNTIYLTTHYHHAEPLPQATRSRLPYIFSAALTNLPPPAVSSRP